MSFLYSAGILDTSCGTCSSEYHAEVFDFHVLYLRNAI